MKFLVALVIFLSIVLLAVVLLTLPTMLLWNWLVPEIFGLPTISFWQAWGLLFLAGLFTSGAGSIVAKKN